jgi:hypothetical protein
MRAPRVVAILIGAIGLAGLAHAQATNPILSHADPFITYDPVTRDGQDVSTATGRWTGTLTGDPAQSANLIHRLVVWMDSTPSRVPTTDTVSGKRTGFQARSVVGGAFIKALMDPTIETKYKAHGPWLGAISRDPSVKRRPERSGQALGGHRHSHWF